MSSVPQHPDLIAAISAYCAAHNLSRSAFGEKVMGDPRFVSDLERGRELRRKTEQRVWAGLRLTPDEHAGRKGAA